MSQLKVCLVFSSLTTRRQAFSSSQPRLKRHFAIMSSLTAEYLSFHNDQPVGAACVWCECHKLRNFDFLLFHKPKKYLYIDKNCVFWPLKTKQCLLNFFLVYVHQFWWVHPISHHFFCAYFITFSSNTQGKKMRKIHIVWCSWYRFSCLLIPLIRGRLINDLADYWASIT